MIYQEYDIVLLKDGRKGQIVEVLGDHDLFLVDIEIATEEGALTWEHTDVWPKDIERLLKRPHGFSERWNVTA